MRRVLGAVVLVTVLGASVLAAPVGAQDVPSPQERVRNSADATAAAGSARFEGDVSAEGETVVSFAGAVTLDDHDGDVSLTFGDNAPVSAMEARVVGGTYFVELAPLADVVLGGLLDDLSASVRSKDWVRVTPAQLTEVGIGVSGSDPASQLALLRAIRDVEEVGPEDVAGEPTTHYRGVADVRQAIRRAPRDERPRLRAAFDAFDRNRVPIDVWLDGDDRLRRIDVVATVDLRGTGEGDEVEEGLLSAVYSDFGTPVTAEAPARRTVVGFDAFLDAVREAAAGGGGGI